MIGVKKAQYSGATWKNTTSQMIGVKKAQFSGATWKNTTSHDDDLRGGIHII
jgi:hypothetical protein